MGKRERLHRQDPERTAPIRNASTYLRDAPPGADKPQSKASAGPAESAVAHGVQLGYKVIEEQIREGQRLAQQLRRSGSKAGDAGTDELGELIERVLRLYKEMGAVCFSAVEVLAKSPLVRSGIARAWQGKPEPRVEPGARFSVDVACSRRTQVSIDLQPHAERFIPLVHALHAADPTIPPLTAVRFEVDHETARHALLVTIDDTQLPATYTGVIADSATNEPRGTLSVRIFG